MIEQAGTNQGVESAMVAPANIIANATKVIDLRSVDIKMDDVWWTVTLLVSRGVKQAERKLKTGTLKHVVLLLCTVVPLMKLCTTD